MNNTKKNIIARQQELTEQLLENIAKLEFSILRVLKVVAISLIAGLVAYFVFQFFFGSEKDKNFHSSKVQYQPSSSIVWQWIQKNIGILLLEYLKNKLFAYWSEQRKVSSSSNS
ncbi:MAG: hypothetical protein NZM38_02590 [Cytophagales bacterium]|nr:hypothetical protein [Cytophagales bacterium]MDW8383641.1 hypothetical protein [Flammeovirgaceae bacterium]